MDRYEQRANERDELLQNAYRKSGEPPTYFDNDEIKEYMAVTDLIRKASNTFTPPGEEKK